LGCPNEKNSVKRICKKKRERGDVGPTDPFIFRELEKKKESTGWEKILHIHDANWQGPEKDNKDFGRGEKGTREDTPRKYPSSLEKGELLPLGKKKRVSKKEIR